MNKLINASQNLTMSSREIAKLINKEHANIKISAERLAEKGVILTLATQEFEHNGNSYTEYLLNKRDSLILVAQNCPEFTAAIVDRWQELEAQQQTKLPTTYKAALLALVAAEEERERLELKNINLTTVVDDLTDWSSIIRIAKHNGVSEKIFKWRLLKAKSLELGYAIKQVPSARYDYQNLYHLNSFRACYPQFDYNLNREVLN